MILLWYFKNKLLRLVSDDLNILNDLYYGVALIPTELQLQDYVNKNDKFSNEVVYIKKHSSTKGMANVVTIIKTELSKINIKMPLYDEYTRNMFLISRDDIYDRVIYYHYRFPDTNMIKKFRREKLLFNQKYPEINKDDLELLKLKSMSEFTELKGEKYKKRILEIRHYKKLNLMIDFLGNFDIEILYLTYQSAFYEYSNKAGKNITICVRPSFKPYFTHIKPYYTRSELINLGLNMRIIKPDNKFYDKKGILELCEKIKTNDITNETLLNHQMHIVKSGNVGSVQYYSLQGSFFINQYLRKLVNYRYQNELLENLSSNIWKLILSAPAFDKEYILYRFIHNDTHMGYLKIGDIYTVNGFLSTTRDPFYNSDEYKFGFVLIKIKMPSNLKGIGLCIETISHFPKEQEILLAPLTKLRLTHKNENAEYYHTDHLFVSEIVTRYEFEYVSNCGVKFDKREKLIKSKPIIDFLNSRKQETLTINEKIIQFTKDYVNEMGQFETKIGNSVYRLNIEMYDSTSVYSKFYAKRVPNGISIYLLIDNSINFFIELGEDTEKYIYINYYFRFSGSEMRDSKNNISFDKNDFIMFLSSLAYYFSVPKIIIFADYAVCDSIKSKCNHTDNENSQIFRGGNYCMDFYEYLRIGEKKYENFDSTELHSNFYYYILDSLKSIDPLRVLDRNDRDEVYQIYLKAYVPYYDKKNHNIADFYIWMVNNYCYCLYSMIEKMYRIFPENNPFKNDSYTLNPFLYLYNKNLINQINVDDNVSSKASYELMAQFKNNYRLSLLKDNAAVK